jgi:hypothetical protein
MIEVYKHIGMLDVFRSFISRVVLSTPLHECVLSGYIAIFEDMSNTTDSMYSNGGAAPDSEYFASPNKPTSFGLVTTDMDDSDQWNGSEMDDFDGDDSDLVDELKIYDITHVTTQIDNNHPLVDKFHSTAPYVGIINMIKDNADTDRFDPKSHIGKKKTGVYHLPVNSKLMKHPEIWTSK